MAETLAEADEECKHLWDNLSLQYTESQGLPQLRAEISQLYNKIGADDTIVLAPEEGIYLTMRALLSRGDHVVVFAWNPPSKPIDQPVTSGSWARELIYQGGSVNFTREDLIYCGPNPFLNVFETENPNI